MYDNALKQHGATKFVNEIVDKNFADASNMFSSNVIEHETEAALFNEQGMLTEDGIKEMVEEEPALADFRAYLEGIYS